MWLIAHAYIQQACQATVPVESYRGAVNAIPANNDAHHQCYPALPNGQPGVHMAAWGTIADLSHRERASAADTPPAPPA